MATIVTRAGKGTTLTWAEMDANLTNLKAGAVLSVKDSVYGAVGNGVTDDSTAIQAAINAAEALGGGKVYFDVGTYIIGTTLTLPSKVILVGQGSSTTILKAKNSLNAAIIQSKNYSTLVGTDTWLIANGNNYAFGLKDLKIDGNKTNQSSGNGVNFYGKRFFIENVIITSCKQEGWHSESNYSIPGTPATNGDDLPEGSISNLYIWQCDSHGMVFRGQHDTFIDSLFIGVCGGWGIRFETHSTAPYYSGNCNSGIIHVYANTLGGIYIGSTSTHTGSILISENNENIGIQCDGWQCQFGSIQLYSNCKSAGTFQGVFSGSECSLGDIQVKDTGQNKSGIQITGYRNIGSVNAIASGSTGVALDIAGVSNIIQANITGFNGVGGIAVRTGNASQVLQSNLTIHFNDCKTGWVNSSIGSKNTYNINGYCGVGQTFFSGSGPNVSNTEFWNVTGTTNGSTAVSSKLFSRSLNAVDCNITTEQEITIAHGLVTIPLIQNITATLSYLNSNLVWEMSRIYIRSVDATNIKVRVKMRIAAGGADTADLLVTAFV